MSARRRLIRAYLLGAFGLACGVYASSVLPKPALLIFGFAYGVMMALATENYRHDRMKHKIAADVAKDAMAQIERTAAEQAAKN